MKTNFWAELIARIKHDTPDFFITLRKWTLSLATSAALVLAASNYFPSFHLSEKWSDILTNICVAGFVLSGGTFLPKKD